MKKKEKIRLIGLVLIIGACIALISLIIYLQGDVPTVPAEAAKDFAVYLACFLVCCFGIVPAAVVFMIIVGLIWSQSFRTAAKLAADKLAAWIQTKNVAVIYPRLQCFLYEVLSLSSDILHLPLGQDPSCLTPCGKGAYTRCNCVFYPFALLMPEAPEMEESTLRQLMQSCVYAELNNYGVAGLRSCFQSRTNGSFFSIYIDRVRYHEKQHLLTFDVLYICTEETAKYAQEAIKRDTKHFAPEQEVFDDEVQ